MNFTNTTDHTDMALHLTYDADMREDHYDGEHSLYRLSAYAKFNTHLYLPEASKELEYVVDYLSQLPVRPHHLFVDNGYGWEVVWYAKEHQVVTSQKQYVQLILEFVSFLEQNESPFFSFVLQEGFLLDDPAERISGLPNEALNFSPEFNASCFGNDDEIEVMGLKRC